MSALDHLSVSWTSDVFYGQPQAPNNNFIKTNNNNNQQKNSENLRFFEFENVAFSTIRVKAITLNILV